MTTTADIRPEHLAIILLILRKHLSAQAHVYIFGSRAKHTAKPFSDLDLAIDHSGQALSLACLSALHSDFDESDLPYKVDIVDLATISPAFQKMIAQDLVALIFP